jgi:predicted amino acid-binding ACT domain protein
MPHFAVTAIGSDRPGIVAGLTEALRDVGGNGARALQHEVDHLDGFLILDRVESSSDLFPRRTYR